MDLVIVATKIEERAYYATQAMTAGFHVLCEKPVAMNMKELEEIIAISDKTGKKFTVHQPRRFDRDYLMLKEVIDSHVIGDVHLFLVTVQMLILNGSMQKMMNLQWESWKHFRVAESMTLRKKHSLETNHTLQDAADLTNCMQ